MLWYTSVLMGCPCLFSRIQIQAAALELLNISPNGIMNLGWSEDGTEEVGGGEGEVGMMQYSCMKYPKLNSNNNNHLSSLT